MSRDNHTPPDEGFEALPMPPALFSNEAEQSVLGGLMLDNGAFDRVGDSLLAEHFFDEQHRRIYTSIVRMLMANKPADVITVFHDLTANGHNDNLGYLNSLAASVPSAANIRRYAAIVAERWKARQLMAVGSRTVELAQDGSIDINTRVEQVQAEVGKLAEQGAQREAASLDEAMVRAVDRLSERAEGNINAFATGVADIDDMLNGGIRPGNVVVMAARPSMGKTALALTVALNMARDRGIGFLSMEMPEEELTDRTFAFLGRVDLGTVQRPANAPDDFWTRITEAMEQSARLRLYIDDQGGLNIHQATAKIRNLVRKHKVQVVIVDYLQLMNGTDAKVSRTYQLEEVMRSFKALAKSLGIAIVVLAQINRKVENGMPSLFDLKDSGAIEQDADVVMFIHRPIQVEPELGPEWSTFAQLRFAKNRQGRTGDTYLSYLGNQTRFAGWSGEIPTKSAKSRSKTPDL